jgi:hypothetical protein
VTFACFVFFEAEVTNFTQRKNNYSFRRTVVYSNRKRKAVSISVVRQNCSSILNSPVGYVRLLAGCQLCRACKGIVKVKRARVKKSSLLFQKQILLFVMDT